MLDAQSLTKSYGARPVVAGLSLQLAAGEIVGLLGPNGAGKSTTVAMLCGLVMPDSGQVRIATPGQPGAGLDTVMGAGNPALKRRIGLVPQDLALHEDLSAEANLRLFGALYGLGGDRLRQQVAAALDLVGLADRARDKPATFSGGMKRRLNIACALVHDPDILLFDEPTVGVDPQSRNAIFDNLETLRARGKALLYTTHYMEEAERLCDRLVVMDHGRVVAADTLAGLYQRLPVAQTLTITLAGTVDLAALTRDTGVPTAVQHGGVLTVGLAGRPDSASGLAAPAAAVLGWLATHGHAVSHLASNRANLEDVFLALTGRQLRD
jgi:ABC-2 type transport system ATP-binding protein